MSNSFVTANLIAQRALPLLAEKTAMLPLVYRGYDDTYKKAGDTIQVRKPVRQTAIDTSGDISSSYADVKESGVNIQLSRQYGVPVALTSKELTLNIDDFTRMVTAPAITAIAEDINGSVLGLYKDIPYFTGTSGSAPSSLSNLAQAAKILNVNLAPMDMRALVMNFDAEAKLRELDSLVEVDKSGTNEALRRGILGQVYGMMLASDGQVKTHTAGAYTALEDVTIRSGAAGATTVTLGSAANASTATLLAGDIFSIGNYQFTVTATTAAAVAGDIASVSIYPALPAAYDALGTLDVVFPDVTAGGHVANLAFQRDAFALAMAPLAPPMGGADAAVVNFRGLSIRVVMDYNFNVDKNIVRFDVLYGVKTMFPELAVRLLG